jgi:predicted nicotinamide N-methyase
MPSSSANLRAFVRRHTRFVALPDLPDLRLHLAEDVATVWHKAGQELGDLDPPLPYWAFAWSGGLAIARYLVENPDAVAGRRVLDVATGSGLCAIVAARVGAGSVLASDIDRLAVAAAEVNSRANNVRIGVTRDDLLTRNPPPVDVILAGDVSYEETMATRMFDWLGQATEAGIRVLIGDPGRTYLRGGLVRVATYPVHPSREIESVTVRESSVYTFPVHDAAGGRRG